MLIILPDWAMELENKLDKVIKDIAIKNHIDLTMINDSKSIESGKSHILHALVRIYENYDVEGRERLEKMEKDFKKEKQKDEKNKKRTRRN
jgi:hypothetical protein